jgi:hypothetical protein
VGLLALFSAFFMEEVKVASELDGVKLEQLRGIYGDLLALAKELQKKENRLVARQDKLLDEEAFRC